MLEKAEKEFEVFLKQSFQAVTKEFNKYFINKGTKKEITIQPKDIFVFINGETTPLLLLTQKVIMDFSKKNRFECIVVVNQDKHGRINTLSTSENTSKIMSWLLKINHLTPSFDFSHSAIFDSQLGFNTDGFPEIHIKHRKETIFVIKSDDDIIRVNDFQNKSFQEIAPIKDKVLDIVQQYDPTAHYVPESGGIHIFNHIFLFTFKRNVDYWYVNFFRTFNTSGMMKVQSLDEITEKIYVMADNFAVEERLYHLFKDDY